MTSRSRFLVAQPDPRPAPGAACEPLPIGVVRWPEDRVSIVVKATLTYARAALAGGAAAIEVAAVADRQEPLWLARPSRLPGAAPAELEVPSDFVLWRPHADVLLHGHAYAREAAGRIDARISVVGSASGGLALLDRPFSVVGEPAERLPLSLGALRAPDGESPTDPVGARGPEPIEEARDPKDEAAAEDDGPTVSLGSGAPGGDGERRSPTDVEGGAAPRRRERGVYYFPMDTPVSEGGVTFAAPAQRAADIPPDAVIELRGLSPGGGARRIQLPGVWPRVRVEDQWAERPILMACDTLWIDTDRELIVLVFRGQAHMIAGGRHTKRIVVSLEREAAPRSAAEIERALRRAVISRAIEQADLEDPEPKRPDPMLAIARYARLAEAADPLLPIEQYAAIGAEVAEQRAPRREVLARHGLSEDDWMIEERAWLERMGDAAMSGDDGLASRYGALFVAAQDALATPAEQELTMDDYAVTRVAVDAQGMTRALHERSMTMSEWMRLERRWTRAADADEQVQDELERRLQAARLAYAAADSGRNEGAGA